MPIAFTKLTFVDGSTAVPINAANLNALETAVDTLCDYAALLNAANVFTNATESTSTTTGAVTIAGGLGVAKNIYASKVFNAVWNDIADFIQVEPYCEIEYGKAYAFVDNEHHKSTKYAQKGVVGIASDTFGFGVGQKQSGSQIPIAIGGFVLAHCDKVYEAGTPLTCTRDGKLTKANMITRLLHPERVLGIFYKQEVEQSWHKIAVNGRHWVKVS